MASSFVPLTRFAISRELFSFPQHYLIAVALYYQLIGVLKKNQLIQNIDCIIFFLQHNRFFLTLQPSAGC